MGKFLNSRQRSILQEAHLSTKLRKQADRIKTILFLNEEFTYEQTAYLLMLDDMTVGAMKKNMGIFEQSPEKVK